MVVDICDNLLLTFNYFDLIMTSIKVKTRLDGARVWLQVICGRKVRKVLVDGQREKVRRALMRMHRVVRQLEEVGTEYAVEDVVAGYKEWMGRYGLLGFMQSVIDTLRGRTAANYVATLRSFKKFRGCEDVMLDCLTPALMAEYEAWLKSRGVCRNTSSFYLRILRAVYNRAVAEGAIDDMKPFAKVYTGVDKTTKRAVTLSTLKAMCRLKLSAPLAYARDMFLLSFYLRGMSPVDMAHLRQTDLRGGSVVYRRRKTGQQLSVAWTAEMQVVVDRYINKVSGQHLLPIMPVEGKYESQVARINRGLKKISARLGLTAPLTLYAARHSWASAARDNGIAISVISEGMGHTSETTTRVYLTSISSSVIDRANAMILKKLQ